MGGGGRSRAASSLPSSPFAERFGGLRRIVVVGKLRLALRRNSAPKGNKGSEMGFCWVIADRSGFIVDVLAISHLQHIERRGFRSILL